MDSRQLALLASLLWPAVLVGLLLLLWRVRGRGYRRARPAPAFDIPAHLPPAEVVCFLEPEALNSNAVCATMLDLIDRGFVTLEPVRAAGAASPSTDHLLTRVDRPTTGLARFETDLLRTVFGFLAGADVVTVGQLRRCIAERPEEWARYLREFDAEVHHACLEDGLWDQPERTWMSLLQVLGIATMVVAVLATLGLGRGWPLVGVVVGWVVVLLAGRQLYRPRPHALQLYRRYAALREFMRASGGMDDKPAEAVAVWDEYLVLAVGLGLARHAVLDLGVESAPDVTADLLDELLVPRSP